MARRKRPSAVRSEQEPPPWFWQWRPADWGLPAGLLAGTESAHVEAVAAGRVRWRRARDAWLAEHGLVVWPMGGITWQEYQRVCREEPHLVLRRSD